MNAIEAKAKKDFSFYEGLIIPVSIIDVSPGGLIELGEYALVKVTDYLGADYNGGYLDTTWAVELTDQAIKVVRDNLVQCGGLAEVFDWHVMEGTTYPTIRGFVYSIEAGQVDAYYRGWK